MIALLMSAGLAASDAESIGAWVPSSLLASLVIVLGAIVTRSFLKRLDDIEKSLAKIMEVTATMNSFASKDSLASVASRFDERCVGCRERIAVLEARK